MTPELLLERFGYLAVFIGTFLEGEGILVIAGFFAQRGYLLLSLVIVTAFLGSFAGHLFWFWLGRSKGIAIVKRFPKIEKHLGKGVRLFERWGAPAIILSQYLYGVRISCAIIVGFSRIPIPKFLFYQSISCASWSIVIAGLGFYFGEAVETFLGRAAHVERYAIAVLAVIGLSFWLWHRVKERRENAASE